MAIPTISETLNNLTVATLKSRQKEMPNQIFERWVFWRKLKEKGHIQMEDGSRKITMDVEYAVNPTVKGFARGGTLPGEDYEYMTQSEYDWKFIGGASLRYYQDTKKNRGKKAVRKLVTTGIRNLENSIIAKIETDLFLDGTGDSSNTILGLQKLVPDAAATGGTVGNINGDNETWWRNKSANMTGKAVSTYLRDYMNRMYNDCSLIDHGDDSFPDFYIADQKTTETYDTESFELLSVVNQQKTGDIAISDLAFKGRPIHWSPKLPEVTTNNGRLYFLNTNFLFVKVMDNAAIEFVDWKPASGNSLDWILHGVFNGAFVTNSRASQGVIYNIANQSL